MCGVVGMGKPVGAARAPVACKERVDNGIVGHVGEGDTAEAESYQSEDRQKDKHQSPERERTDQHRYTERRSAAIEQYGQEHEHQYKHNE